MESWPPLQIAPERKFLHIHKGARLSVLRSALLAVSAPRTIHPKDSDHCPWDKSRPTMNMKVTCRNRAADTFSLSPAQRRPLGRRFRNFAKRAISPRSDWG
jgi:hypothetical protein